MRYKKGSSPYIYTFIVQTLEKLGDLASLFGIHTETTGHRTREGLERRKNRAGKGQGSGPGETKFVGSCF